MVLPEIRISQLTLKDPHSLQSYFVAITYCKILKWFELQLPDLPTVLLPWANK